MSYVQTYNKSQAFTSSGTWTAPAGVTVATVLLVGGGGAGGGVSSGSSYSPAGGHGGGGGQMMLVTVPVTAGSSYTVTIGAGGTGGTGNGNNGGDTSFGTLAYAGGGQGGGQSIVYLPLVSGYRGGGLGGGYNNAWQYKVNAYDATNAIYYYSLMTGADYPYGYGGGCRYNSSGASYSASSPQVYDSIGFEKGGRGLINSLGAGGGCGGFYSASLNPNQQQNCAAGGAGPWGAPGGTAATTGTLTQLPGGGGGSYGAGANGSTTSDTAGTAASANTGGGGSGAARATGTTTTYNGGAGGSGYCVVYWNAA